MKTLHFDKISAKPSEDAFSNGDGYSAACAWRIMPILAQWVRAVASIRKSTEQDWESLSPNKRLVKAIEPGVFYLDLLFQSTYPTAP